MSATNKNISKTVQSRTDSLSEVREFVAALARTHGFPEDEVANIVLAVDEACTNIIKHAYQNATDKLIDVSVSSSGRAFEITIADDGRAFDPSILRNPDLKDHLTHYRRGGLGVYLMKKLMDAVEYQFQPGQKNRVRLVKYLPGTAPQ
jgi:serine/threonine-protein kinase RsbW